jgi:hypothetical protein
MRFRRGVRTGSTVPANGEHIGHALFQRRELALRITAARDFGIFAPRMVMRCFSGSFHTEDSPENSQDE